MKSLSPFFVRIVPIVTITLLASTLMGMSAASALSAIHHPPKVRKATGFIKVAAKKAVVKTVATQFLKVAPKKTASQLLKVTQPKKTVVKGATSQFLKVAPPKKVAPKKTVATQFLKVAPPKKALVKTVATQFLKVAPPKKALQLASLKASDPTNTQASKNSRSVREKVSLEAWVASYTARRVAYAESRNNCKSTGSHGKYRGKWQMDSDFWATYGGLKFAKMADLATCGQQDIVARNGWISRHWQPWETYTLEN